jgi:hypothetical protein
MATTWRTPLARRELPGPLFEEFVHNVVALPAWARAGRTAQIPTIGRARMDVIDRGEKFEERLTCRASRRKISTSRLKAIGFRFPLSQGGKGSQGRRPGAALRRCAHADVAQEGFHDDQTSEGSLRSHPEGREACRATHGDGACGPQRRNTAAQLGCIWRPLNQAAFFLVNPAP